MVIIRNFAKKTMKINNPMPDQTIGITKIVRAAKAQKEINKTVRMANAMAMADTMKQGPLSHNLKKK